MAGQLFEGGRFVGERGITTRPGQAMQLRAGAPADLLGNLQSADALKAAFKPNDWNQYRIVVRAGVAIHIINGNVVSVTIDDDAAKRFAKGLIGLQIEGADLKVSVREIWLKTL